MVLRESGSGDHPYPSSQKFGNLTSPSDFLPVYPDNTPPPYDSALGKPSGRQSGDWYGEWRYDRGKLRSDLANGRISLDDRLHQERFLDWMRDESMIVFQDRVTKEKAYSPVCRRGNRQYALKKARQRDCFLKAIRGKILDHPVGSNPNVRDTHALLITLTFDKKRHSKEEAWACLSSTKIEDSEIATNVLNKLSANLRSIFGPICKITVKEAQEDGYPAPHLIVFLDRPVRVKLHRGKGGHSWRIMDPHILKRIGKDPTIRRIAHNRHSDAILMNPIWKHGFIDVQGIVKGARFRNRRDAVSYAYKYLTKSLTDDHGEEVSELNTVSECSTKSLRIALWGHLCNKSFGLRDITYGKKVKEYLGMLPDEPVDSGETISWWEYKRTIPKSSYDFIMVWEARRALRPFKSTSESTT